MKPAEPRGSEAVAGTSSRQYPVGPLPDPDPDSRARRSPATQLAAAGALLLAILWGVLLWDLRQHASFARDESHRELETVAEIGAQALRFALRSIDVILLDLREQWQSDPEGLDRRVRLRQAEARIIAPFTIEVIGRDGRLTYSSANPSAKGTDLGSRAYFRASRDSSEDDELAIVGPFSGAPSERPMIQFVRPLRSRDGNIAGVIAFEVTPSTLLQAVRAGHLSENTALTLARDDGSILTRSVVRARAESVEPPGIDDAPFTQSTSTSPLAALSRMNPDESGFLRMRDPLDATERLVSWRSIAAYPLTLVVSEPASALDKEIARLRRRYLLAGALGSALLALAFHWLLRNRRARDRAAIRQREHYAELARSAAELRTTQQQFRDLAAHQMALKEEERKRIAQEIHDELGQRLTVLRMDLSMLPRTVSADPSQLLPRQVGALKSSLDGIMTLVRDIAGRLRPATLDIGLGAAVEGLVEEIGASLGISCELDNRLPPGFVLDDKLATAAFRIIQESLTNVVRHAGASHVRVTLAVQDGDLLAQVHDDGRGFDSETTNAKLSFGTSGMRARAAMLGGRVTITGKPGKGTVVDARIPLPPAAAAGRAPSTGVDTARSE